MWSTFHLVKRGTELFGYCAIDQSSYWDTSFLVDIREEPFEFRMLLKMDKSQIAAGCGVIRFDSKTGKMNQGYATSSSQGLIIMAGGWDTDDDTIPIMILL